MFHIKPICVAINFAQVLALILSFCVACTNTQRGAAIGAAAGGTAGAIIGHQKGETAAGAAIGAGAGGVAGALGGEAYDRHKEKKQQTEIENYPRTTTDPTAEPKIIDEPIDWDEKFGTQSK